MRPARQSDREEIEERIPDQNVDEPGPSVREETEQIVDELVLPDKESIDGFFSRHKITLHNALMERLWMVQVHSSRNCWVNR